MALFSLDDLTQPASRDDVKNSVYTVLGILGIDTTAWEPGAVTRTLIVAFSAVLSALSVLQAEIAKSGFLDLAQGEWLRLVAHYVYGVDYIQASFASGTLTLSNSGGGLYIVAAGDLQVAHTTSGKTYRNTTGFTLNPTSNLDIPIQAEETGSASTAATNTITTIVTSLSPDVTCTNAAALIGDDDEADPQLRLRCREKLGALSPMGPWDAYAYAARNATLTTGESAGITRTRLTKNGYGNVTLYVATATGAASGAALTAASDAVEAQAVPLAVAATTMPAVEQLVTVEYSAWVYNTSGLTTQQVKDAVFDALTAFFSTLPISGALLTPGGGTGYVYRDQLYSVIDNALPEIFHVTITQPAADVALTNEKVATLDHDTATDATITQVAPPEGASV